VAVIVGVTLAAAIDRTALVERLAYDTILRPREMRVLPGGKGVNVCRAARRLGADVVTTGICGGHAGRWLIEALQREGLAPHFVATDAETRTTYVTVDGTGRSVLVYEPTPPVPPTCLGELVTVLRRDLLPGASWLVGAGSLPVGLEADSYAQLVTVARTAGVRSLVDTGGPALRAALSERPDVVKVSRVEAADALQAPAFERADALARRLADGGACLAIVTDGPRGAAAADGRHAWSVRVPRMQARNPIGAGDAFSAGLVIALADGKETPDALALAAGAAAASVVESGAGELDPVRVAELRGRIGVREVTRGTW
jgi:1-phosphofructokinase family hexose kinase